MPGKKRDVRTETEVRVSRHEPRDTDSLQAVEKARTDSPLGASGRIQPCPHLNVLPLRQIFELLTSQTIK